MSAKQVHVLTKYFSPVTAGIETNILETYSVLARVWDVHIHTTTDEHTRHNSLRSQTKIRALHVHRYPYLSDIRGYQPKINYASADIIALHNFNLYYWRVFARVLTDKLLGRKKYQLIVTPHGGFSPAWSLFPLPGRLLKYVYHATVGVFCLNYLTDKIRAVSEWEKTLMVKWGVNPRKITVIHNGLEAAAYTDVDQLASQSVRQLTKRLGRYIIQIGRIYPIKNYETVIRALPTVPGVKFLIVGQEEKSAHYHDYLQSLHELAQTLGVGERVIFGGVHRGVDKYFLLRHAQLMVHLALYESYCNAVHEGLSQGLICLVANNTALPYLIQHGVNGYLVPTHDSAGLAARLNFVLSHLATPSLIRMQAQNRAGSRNQSWSHVAKRVQELYV